MYAFIEGIMDSIEDTNVIVVTNGIGYEIMCANPYQFQSKLKEKVKIFTYHYVREDQQLLFGFKEKEEKQLFIKLLSVSGIGPKSALAIIGSSSVGQIATAIEHEDEKFLTTFPGVGKKTARQIILDLKGKVTEWIGSTSTIDGATDQEHDTHENVKMFEEALEALRSLGYSEREIKRISTPLSKSSSTSVDEYIKKGLSLMMEQK